MTCMRDGRADQVHRPSGLAGTPVGGRAGWTKPPSSPTTTRRITPDRRVQLRGAGRDRGRGAGRGRLRHPVPQGRRTRPSTGTSTTPRSRPRPGDPHLREYRLSNFLLCGAGLQRTGCSPTRCGPISAGSTSVDAVREFQPGSPATADTARAGTPGSRARAVASIATKGWSLRTHKLGEADRIVVLDDGRAGKGARRGQGGPQTGAVSAARAGTA